MLFFCASSLYAPEAASASFALALLHQDSAALQRQWARGEGHHHHLLRKKEGREKRRRFGCISHPSLGVSEQLTIFRSRIPGLDGDLVTQQPPSHIPIFLVTALRKENGVRAGTKTIWVGMPTTRRDLENTWSHICFLDKSSSGENGSLRYWSSRGTGGPLCGSGCWTRRATNRIHPCPPYVPLCFRWAVHLFIFKVHYLKKRKW